MRLRARLEHFFNALWQTRGLGARLLYPLSLLTNLVRRLSHWCYQVGLLQPQHLPVPVIVVGNLYVGGTGKTPLVLELVAQLRARGYTPGVVSRGYGAQSTHPRKVDPHASPEEYGDEPLLLAQRGHIPVAVGRDRVAAARLLLRLHPECNLLITDDGLQHPRLARDIELVVIHTKGLGNGWLLPAGPLRDTPSRLRHVDAVIFHGPSADIPVVRVHSPFFRMHTRLGAIYAMKDPSHRSTLTDLLDEQSRHGTRLVAAAGIGQPERFFSMLSTAGLHFESIALEDHYDFKRNPFAGHTYDCALITEKDAVKCKANPEIAADGRICVVSLETSVDSGLIDFIVDRLPAPARADSNNTTANYGPQIA